MLQQAQHAQPPQSPDGDGLGKASTPPNSPRDGKPQSGVSTPTGAGSPIGSDDDSSSSSSESVADLPQQLLEGHVSLNLQLEQLEIHLQVLQSLVI